MSEPPEDKREHEPEFEPGAAEVAVLPPTRRARAADVQRAIRVGSAAVLLAAILDALLAGLARSLLGAPEAFLPLRSGPALFLVLSVGALGVLLFVVLLVFTSRPRHWFRIAAWTTAVLSCASPLSLLLDPDRVPGTNGATVAAAVVLHLIPAAMLTRLLGTRTGVAG